jgi:YD repeat-containing protein
MRMPFVSSRRHSLQKRRISSFQLCDCDSSIPDGNTVSRVTRKGDTISFAYDTLNRVCTKAIATSPTACSATSSANPTAWFAYDLAGLPAGFTDNSASVTSAVPPTGGTVSYSASYSFDALNRPIGASWNPAPTQTMPSSSTATFAFGYDATNRRANQSATDKSWWNYPATASSVNYTPNTLNQYSAVGAVTPTYDANGNLTSDGTYTYGYDAENRLTGITQGMTTIATYAYDAQGRRKSKTVGGRNRPSPFLPAARQLPVVRVDIFVRIA